MLSQITADYFLTKRIKISTPDRELQSVIVDSSVKIQSNEVELGSRYPAGVYNLIVKQGENVKTVRVVKK